MYRNDSIHAANECQRQRIGPDEYEEEQRILDSWDAVDDAYDAYMDER